MTGFLDNHPASERDLRKGQRLDSDHVIVDRDDWEQARTLQDTVGRLQAIVDKLPKTADGHIYLPWEEDGVEGKYWAVWRYRSEWDDEPWQVCAAHIEIGEAPSYWVIEEAEDDNIEVLGVYRCKEAAEAAGGE